MNEQVTEAPTGRTFIPQEPRRYDKATDQMVSIMNFNKARKFGEPTVLMPTGPQALNVAPTIWALKDKLRDFSDNDYLIAVGDPTLIAMTAIICAEVNMGRVKLLKWDKDTSQYIRVDFDLYRKLGGDD
jgi:hypothetical protein